MTEKVKVKVTIQNLEEAFKKHFPDTPFPTDQPGVALDLWNTKMPEHGHRRVLSGETYIMELEKQREGMQFTVNTLDDFGSPCGDCGCKVRRNWAQTQLHTKLSGIVKQLGKCIELVKSNPDSYLWLGESKEMLEETAKAVSAPAVPAIPAEGAS